MAYSAKLDYSVKQGSTLLITRITGKLVAVELEAVTLAAGAFEYEVRIPEFTRRQLQLQVGHDVSLHTIEYIEGNPTQGKLTPRLIGFLNPIEREFFEMICLVDGVGVRKALRAMVRPVSEFATLIEEQDTKALAELPGIGPAMAERIVAKLRRKVPKFALLVAREFHEQGEVPRDVVRDAFDVLRSLGHGESEARKLLDSVLASKTKFKDVDTLIQAIYSQKQGK